MATQLHVAHSASIDGAGLIAGGPYWCAQNTVQRALGPCVKGGDIEIAKLLQYVYDSAATSDLDSLEHLKDDRIWLFHGTADTVVAASVVDAAAALYRELVDDGQVVLVNSVAAVHGIPTLNQGAACSEFVEPYLNNCEYDAAGELLNHLLGPLEPRTVPTGELLSFDQRGYAAAQLLDEGLLYVPPSCYGESRCGLHIVLHGCRQSAEFVGDVIARSAGFNEWADANDLVVLYPQVQSSRLSPLNPLGCWDWWGYTGDDYSTQAGPQIAAIKTMIDSLSKTAK